MSGRTHRDGLMVGTARGRAAGLNPGNRFESRRLHVLGDVLDDTRREHPRGLQVRTESVSDHTRTIINRVDSPDLPFNWTINPYRGCEHGCIYCYARPTHEMLGLSCGLDFETKIHVKHDAARLLERELARPGWRAETIVMSGVTDCYQPIEARHEVTRRCLEVMASCRQPVAIVTKNRLVLRDLDLLRELAANEAVCVTLSLTTLDASLAASMEPRASRPADRLRAISVLRDAGVPVTAMIAPVIPGLTDREVPDLVRAAAEAGASSATWVMLRLPYQVESLFTDWLQRTMPERAQRVESRVREVRGGRLSDGRFGTRMRGQGPAAEAIRRLFEVSAARHGLDGPAPSVSGARFRAPRLDGQLDLFG